MLGHSEFLPYHFNRSRTNSAISAHTGDIYVGLWYSVIIASVTLIVGILFVPETRGVAAED
jgi:hypothetical protein